MKRYIDFLLEDTEPVVQLQPETPVQNSGGTVQNETGVTFDITKYNEILNDVKELWIHVFTKRNLNFDKDDDNSLKAKLKNQRYKNYWKKIKSELDRREQSDTEQQNKEKVNSEASSKISDSVSALVNLGYIEATALNVVKQLVNKQPDIQIGALTKAALAELYKMGDAAKSKGRPQQRKKPVAKV